MGFFSSLFGGGSSPSEAIDRAYNSRMASISERQQSIADQYFDFWKEAYQPMEAEQIGAMRGLIPDMADAERREMDFRADELDAMGAQLDLDRDTIGFQQRLLPMEHALAQKEIRLREGEIGLRHSEMGFERQLLGSKRRLLPLEENVTRSGLNLESQRLGTVARLMPQQENVISTFYERALNGEDDRDVVSQASADAAQAARINEVASRRDAARMGVNAVTAANRVATGSTNMARLKLGAISQARNQVRDTNFERLKTAASGIGFGANATL